MTENFEKNVKLTQQYMEYYLPLQKKIKKYKQILDKERDKYNKLKKTLNGIKHIQEYASKFTMKYFPNHDNILQFIKNTGKTTLILCLIRYYDDKFYFCSSFQEKNIRVKSGTYNYFYDMDLVKHIGYKFYDNARSQFEKFKINYFVGL